ncbi:MAG: hypothetical protein FWB87_16460 [Defluviitaleaceae bacterium]|nr:hypothetical protein [Defluviitaleaceae bacterium]MCL2264364.1 hypothetical protein [Defluviitaleaceae bacterium]
MEMLKIIIDLLDKVGERVINIQSVIAFLMGMFFMSGLFAIEQSHGMDAVKGNYIIIFIVILFLINIIIIFVYECIKKLFAKVVRKHDHPSSH